MTIEQVKEFFKNFGIENKIMEFETFSATVEPASKTPGVIPARITKILSKLSEI